jgi:hypothetical protein
MPILRLSKPSGLAQRGGRRPLADEPGVGGIEEEGRECAIEVTDEARHAAHDLGRDAIEHIERTMDPRVVERGGRDRLQLR